MNPPHASLWDAIDALRESDRSRPREAYFFVLAALGHAAEKLPAERRAHPEQRHLHGHELLEGVVELARLEFGPLAVTVFREWGVTRGEDVGRLVFDLVGSGALTARPEDSPDDFRGMPDLLARLSGPADVGASPPSGGPHGGPGRRA